MTSAVKSATRQWSNIRARCAFRECHHTQITRWIPGGHPGIVAGDSWYCSIDCFALAARTPLELLSNRHVVEIQRQPRLPLSLLLVSKGFLTPEQMRQATTQSQNSSEELEAVLVRMGYVTENQLAAARSAQWGYPVLSSDFVGLWVETDVPVGLLKAFRAVPLHYSASANRLLVGFAARVEPQVLELLEKLTGYRVEPCLITTTELEEQLERLTISPGYEEVFVDEPGAPDKMARTVGRTAVQVAAREAVFAQCKDFVVVRVTGKRGRADVVFSLRRQFAHRIHRNFAEIEDSVAVSG
ncbi:MAG TPA: hypothetical protein VF392_13705 [Terracidiphilus sp.]